MGSFLIIFIQFLFKVLIKPEEHNPFHEEFDPVKTVHLVFTVILLLYTVTSVRSYMVMHEFLELYHPCALSELKEYRESGTVILNREPETCPHLALREEIIKNKSLEKQIKENSAP